MHSDDSTISNFESHENSPNSNQRIVTGNEGSESILSKAQRKKKMEKQLNSTLISGQKGLKRNATANKPPSNEEPTGERIQGMMPNNKFQNQADDCFQNLFDTSAYKIEKNHLKQLYKAFHHLAHPD